MKQQPEPRSKPCTASSSAGSAARCPRASSKRASSPASNSHFLLIPPAGTLLSLEQLAAGVHSGHATNPAFRIAIRNVKFRRVLDRHIVVTYEEWQRNALASTPPENARLATVVFETGDKLRWLHVHETRLPGPIEAAGPYDF